MLGYFGISVKAVFRGSAGIAKAGPGGGSVGAGAKALAVLADFGF